MDKRVLIIDDDKWVVMSTQMVLEAEGFEVKSALSGHEGVELAKSFRPQTVLLDIMMPGIDGWETLERLREDETTRETPVIVFSAREDTAVNESRIDVTNVTVFHKPFRPEELVALVSSHVQAQLPTTES